MAKEVGGGGVLRSHWKLEDDNNNNNILAFKGSLFSAGCGVCVRLLHHDARSAWAECNTDGEPAKCDSIREGKHATQDLPGPGMWEPPPPTASLSSPPPQPRPNQAPSSSRQREMLTL